MAKKPDFLGLVIFVWKVFLAILRIILPIQIQFLEI
jgi:hypothetical protein